MNKYKAGDKFIIEIKQPHIVCGEVRYECEGMVLWTPEEDLDNLSQLVQGVDQYSRIKGQQEAWTLVMKLFDMEREGTIEAAFNGEHTETHCVLGWNSYEEAAAKVEAWERRKARKARKACPFCGKTDTLEYDYSEVGEKVCVVCNVNKGGCGGASGYYDTEAKALGKWNSRAQIGE